MAPSPWASRLKAPFQDRLECSWKLPNLDEAGHPRDQRSDRQLHQRHVARFPYPTVDLTNRNRQTAQIHESSSHRGKRDPLAKDWRRAGSESAIKGIACVLPCLVASRHRMNVVIPHTLKRVRR